MEWKIFLRTTGCNCTIILTRGLNIEIFHFSRYPKSIGHSFEGIWGFERPPTYLWLWSCYSFDSRNCSSKHQAIHVYLCPKEWNLTCGFRNARGWYNSTLPKFFLYSNKIGAQEDGSWHICVDYRELNKLTIKDNLPIIVIDELLV